MSLINKEDLMLTLGITDMDCEKCGWYNRATERCKRGSDFEDACCAIEDAPTIEPVRKGHKINQHSYPAKWLCSECGAKHFDFSDKFCSECGVNVEEGE